MTPRGNHQCKESSEFLRTIEPSVPAKLEVHLILNNYGTHKTLSIHA